MPLLSIGLSHHRTPVSIREAVAMDRATVAARLTAWDRHAAWAEGVGEVALLSTCNRTELFLAGRGPTALVPVLPRSAEALLLGPHPDPAVKHYLRIRRGREVVAHLCQIAAGLDSMVVGEAEVLGQVGDAHGLAADAGTTGLILDAAFRSAIRAGRRARAETAIGRTPVSVPGEAVRVLREELGPLDSRRILVVGTGMMARTVARILRQGGVGALRIVGRTPHQVLALAQEAGATAARWEELPSLVEWCDGLVTATTAQEPVLPRRMFDTGGGQRGGRDLVAVDLALPRDIDPAARGLRGLHLLDLDDLQARVAANRHGRLEERPRVEAIVAEEVAQFDAWLHGATLRPVLAAMHARGEAIRRRELERVLRRRPDLDPTIRTDMDRLSRAIVSKLLHGPSARLRTETDPGRSSGFVTAVRDLFGLGRGGDDQGLVPP